MGEILHDNPSLDDRRNKTRSLIFKLDVDTSACTDETHTLSGVPGDVVVTRFETAASKTAATAVEACTCWDNTFTACPTDAVGEAGYIIDISKLEGGSSAISEVLGVKLLRGNNPLYASACLVDEHDTITLLGDNITQGAVVSASGITPAGNIAFELVSSVNFATTDYTQVFEVIYVLK